MTVRRHDIVRFDARKAQKLDNGFLRAPAQISRVGIYEYLNEDGSTRRELRTPDEVFNEDSLRSFSMMPITDGHPAPGWVTADNARDFQRGQMGETLVPAPDNVHVMGTMMITDAGLVRKVLDGSAAETSCGYTCNVEDAAGVVGADLLAKHPALAPWKDQRYDCVQRDIRGNHVAILPRGRAGSAARVKLDKGDAVVVPDPHERVDTVPQEASVKITIRGMTFEVPDQAAEALNLERRDQQEAMDAVVSRVVDLEASVKTTKADADKAAARADAAEAEVKKAKERVDAASSPAAIAALVKERTDLLDVARRAEVEVDAEKFDAAAVKRAVVEKLSGVKLDGKSPDYVAAAFDIARATLDAKVTGADVVAAVEGQDGKGVRTDAVEKDARQDMLDAQNERWKKPIPGAVKVA